MSPWFFFCCLAVWIALASGIAHAAAPAAAVAMVTDLKGRAYATSVAGNSPLAMLAELPSGAELILEPGTDLALVYLGSGHEFRITGSGRVNVGPDLPVFTGSGKLASRTSLLSSVGARLNTAGGRMVQGAVIMRGAAERLRQLAPRQKAFGPRPTFRWALPDAVRTVAFELRGDDQQVLAAAEVTGDRFALPAGIELVPGRQYSWSIAAPGEGLAGRLSTGFMLASPAEQQQFSQMKPDRDGSFSDQVLYALVLERSDFAGEAVSLWKELSDARPHDASLRAKWAR